MNSQVEGRPNALKSDALLNIKRIKKVEIYNAKQAIILYVDLPYMIDFETYEKVEAFYGQCFREFYKDSFENSFSMTIIPIIKNVSIEALVEEKDILLKILSKEYDIWRIKQFIQLECREKNIVELLCSNVVALNTYFKQPTILSKLSYLINEISEHKVKVISNYQEDGNLEEVPDDYFSPMKQFQAIARKTPDSNFVASSKTSNANGNCKILKHINAPVTPINEIIEEEKSVCISGAIFNLESRTLKTEKTLFSFYITDQNDTIGCKVFVPQKDLEDVESILKNASALKVMGKVEHDHFSNELTMTAFQINQTVLACRVEHSQDKRVELHLHTKMSSMDGVSDLKTLIQTAHQFGHPAVAITDHGVVQSFPDAYSIGKKLGIKIIYGVEAYIIDDEIPEQKLNKHRTYHCIILAKNETGLRNLYRLVTESHLRYFQRRPRIPKRLINYAREGLVIGSACEAGELMRYLVEHPNDLDGLEKLATFYDYIEIQPIANNYFMLRKGLVESEDDLRKLNIALFNLGKKMNKPVVATCDVHFANAEDAVYRAILMKSKGFKDAEEQAPLYYRTTEEMLAEFSYLGEEEARNVVVVNSNKIIEDFEDLNPVPTVLHAPFIEGAEEQIRDLTMTKAINLYGNPLPELIEKRVNKELDAIIGNGYAVLYLIAHKLVKNSNENGYVVGSRGSVGSSVVAYFTDITEVNALPPHYRCPNCQFNQFNETGEFGSGADMPDKSCPHCGTPLIKDGFDIPFEIFMGFKGDKIPDIDLNFSGDYQAGAHSYTEELFGKDNVFRAGTIATVAEKTAYGYVKKYFDEIEVKKREAEINRLKMGCTGVKRTTGQHPGGLVVVPKGIDVHDFSPLQRPADDVKTETVTTHFDYHKIDQGLVKLDILGHDDPTVIKMLGDLTGINPTTVSLDDSETLSLFSGIEPLQADEKRLNTKIATYGIPEFNTSFVRQMLEDTMPSSFSDLLRISGFSHGTDVWLNNAQEIIKNNIAPVSHTISTRDDIMLFLVQHGMEEGISFKIMEGVRKGKGLTAEQEEAMRASHIPEWYIESCKKIKYLFPKAHAVAYVMMAFRIAWFKINHPLAFYASYFTVRGIEEFDVAILQQGEQVVRDAILALYNKETGMSAKEKSQVTVFEVALELYVRGYTIHPIDLHESDAKIFKIKDNGLLPPLISVAGLGLSQAEDIIRGREDREYISIEDLKKRGKVGDALVDKLKELGVVSNLPDQNQISLFS